MGQYHRVVNLSRRQFVHPHELGDGLKLMEFGQSTHGTMAALVLLLAGEAWAGDRIAILGDYGVAGDLPEQVVTETGVDGGWYDDPRLTDVSAQARTLLARKGLAVFTSEQYGPPEEPFVRQFAGADRYREPGGSWHIEDAEVSWSCCPQFPEMVQHALNTDRVADELPPLPLIPFTWTQQGDGSDPDWECVLTPDPATGTYRVEQHSLVDGLRYVTEDVLHQLGLNPRFVTAAQLYAELLRRLS